MTRQSSIIIGLTYQKILFFYIVLLYSRSVSQDINLNKFTDGEYLLASVVSKYRLCPVDRFT